MYENLRLKKADIGFHIFVQKLWMLKQKSNKNSKWKFEKLWWRNAIFIFCSLNNVNYYYIEYNIEYRKNYSVFKTH